MVISLWNRVVIARAITTRFRKLINRRKAGRGRGRGTRGEKLHAHRLPLLALCFLAWPLLCSTSPSGHFVSTFAQNPTLSHGPKSPVQREEPKPSDAPSSHHITHERQPHVQSSDHNDHHHQQPQQQQQQERRSQKQQEQQEEEEKPVHPYEEYSWEVNQINPWLSACDLAARNSEDLRDSCGSADISKHCLKPCENLVKKSDYFFEVISRAGSSNVKMTTQTSVDSGNRVNQCSFYLDKSHKEDICNKNFGVSNPHGFSKAELNRFWYISGLHLRHCCEHVVVNALAAGKGGPLENVLKGGEKCRAALEKLLSVDDTASQVYCEFEEIMKRFDCRQRYSVVHNCNHCREAYRKWMCSSLVPHFLHDRTQITTSKGNWTGSRLRPCRSFCYAVEQRCPYLLPTPGLSTQYAGEPTFLCGDPEIPETGEQARKSIIASPDECCYYSCEAGLCHSCTEPGKHGRIHDLPTAPHCNADSAKSDSTEGPVLQQTVDTSTATSSSTLAPPTTTVDQDTLFCGNGRIGRVNTSMSFSNPPTILYIYTVLILTLLI